MMPNRSRIVPLAGKKDLEGAEQAESDFTNLELRIQMPTRYRIFCWSSPTVFLYRIRHDGA